MKGIVYLVGAGPGDPGLLTLRGAELLRRADVLVHDALVNPELLRLAPSTAEIIFAGKRARKHALPQEEVNALLIAKARQGKRVVRLKGGDPYLFGRGGEEAEELAAAKIAFEVVPGISSITAAPNYAGIPVTHRDHCSSFAVVTGHEDPSKGPVDWDTLAKFPGTKIILMGAERIRAIVTALLAGGLAPATPAAMISWGTTGQQQSIEGTLATIADRAEGAALTAPALTVIGDVVRLRPTLNWFERRPLFGKRVVITRAWDQAGQFARQLLELGANVVEIPTIKIVPPEDLTDLKDALVGLNEYNWIVFTSPNGVSTFFDYFFRGFDDLRALGGLRIAAVGTGTAAKLRELHLRVDAMPEEHLASKVAEEMAKCESLDNLKVLLMRAEVANPALPKTLEEMGAIVDDVPCYRTVPETDDPTGAAELLLEEGADWLTFASSSAVNQFHQRFPLPDLVSKHARMKLASIGPETSKAIRKLGLQPSVEAKPHTIDGLVRALTR